MPGLVNARGFRLWVGGATLSTLGGSITFFALGWIAASHGPTVASLVLTAESIPLCLLILVGGAFADRWGVRRVMIACDAFMAIVLAAFAVWAIVDVPVWLLVVVALLSGTAAALRRPAAGVFPRLFATGDDLSKALATATLFQQIAQTAGPTVGGMLLALGGLPLTSALDAATFCVVLVVLLLVRPPHETVPDPGDRRPLAQHMRDGLSAARRAPWATHTLLTIVGMAVTILPLVMLCVPLAGHQRGWSAATTGLVAGAWVVGGMLVMATVARRGMPGPRTALAGPVVAAVGIVLFASTRTPVPAIVALALVGVGASLLTTRILPRFINATPPELLARFQSLLGLAQTGPVLIATPLLGGAISTMGIHVALISLAAILLLTVLAARQAEAQLTRTQTSGDHPG